jgi:secreted trypsin-like serine protease
MKTNKIVTLILTTASIFSFYTGCAPQSKSLKSFEVSAESASHIFGGKASDATFQKENGIVGLVIVSQDIFGNKFQSTCTGTLIDRKLILTAAHCIQADDFSQIIGVASVFVPDFSLITEENMEANVVYADLFFQHEDFQKDLDFENPQDKTIWNDIALIRLEKEAPEDFKTAQIINSSSKKLKKAKLTSLLLSGFGISTPIVRKEVKNSISGEIKVLEVPEKISTSGVLRQVDGIAVTSVTADQKEILLNQRSKKGACHGDSGGPAFITTADNQLIQVGLTSRGTNRLGNCNEDAIYTGLAGYSEWISTNSAALLAAVIQPATEPVVEK